MTPDDASVTPSTSSRMLAGVAWLLVSVPLLWGIWTTLVKAAALFR